MLKNAVRNVYTTSTNLFILTACQVLLASSCCSAEYTKQLKYYTHQVTHQVQLHPPENVAQPRDYKSVQEQPYPCISQ